MSIRFHGFNESFCIITKVSHVIFINVNDLVINIENFFIKVLSSRDFSDIIERLSSKLMESRENVLSIIYYFEFSHL